MFTSKELRGCGCIADPSAQQEVTAPKQKLLRTCDRRRIFGLTSIHLLG
jgi:hypothetical protein